MTNIRPGVMSQQMNSVTTKFWPTIQPKPGSRPILSAVFTADHLISIERGDASPEVLSLEQDYLYHISIFYIFCQYTTSDTMGEA